jgi:hypothetical protein
MLYIGIPDSAQTTFFVGLLRIIIFVGGMTVLTKYLRGIPLLSY